MGDTSKIEAAVRKEQHDIAEINEGETYKTKYELLSESGYYVIKLKKGKRK